MNFRITTVLFGLLLTTLWVFGLMIAHKKASGDKGFVVPSLRDADIKIDKIVVKKSEKGKAESEITFEMIGEKWYQKDGKPQVRVEGFRVDQIVNQIKGARPEENADVSNSLSNYGLDKPNMTITLSGKVKVEPKQWKLFIGKDSPDQTLVYVNSSEQSEKAFAVSKKNMESLFFKDPRDLRSKRLFDFVDTAVSTITIKKGDKELELKREGASAWTFVKPPYGFAGFDAEPEEKKLDLKKQLAGETINSVKSLLTGIKEVRVEEEKDFEPLGEPASKFGVDTDKANMRIEIASSADKKETTKEILLIGDKVQGRDGEFYYARLADDDGVMMISARWLRPIINALDEPSKLRSHDVAAFEPKDIDAVVVKHGKEDVLFFKQEEKIPDELKQFMKGRPDLSSWQMIISSESKKASDSAVKSLIDAVLGKKAIVEFDDVAEADLKAKEAEWGFDKPSAVIEVFTNSVEIAKKAEKEEPKDEKQKKDEKEKKEPLPTIRKDAKPVVKLELGKIDKEVVHVRRTLPDGAVTRFTMKKEFADKVSPPEGIELTYLDTSAPPLALNEVASLKLERTTDKGKEVLDLERRVVDGQSYWYVKDPSEAEGVKLAESMTVSKVVGALAQLPIKKWVKKLDDKEDLAKYGLKPPVITASITIKKSAQTAASIAAALAGTDYSVIGAACGALLQREADPGETVTIEIGKDSDQEKDKGTAFARRSGLNMLFLVDTQFVKAIKEVELRDRTSMMYVQGQLEALYKTSAAVHPLGALLIASPHFSGQVVSVDADKVKELRLSVRTRSEMRSFQFERVGKDKDKVWTDKSGLVEFQLDPDKVKQLATDLAKLRASRFVAVSGGPRSEHKLGPKEYSVKLDITTEDGKAITLLIGASYQNHGFFAHSSELPEAVFFVPPTFVEPLLRGADHFGKERAAAE